MSSATSTLTAIGGDFVEQAFARLTDPITSHEAAETVSNINEQKAVILKLLKTTSTDEQLVEAYNASASLGYAPKVTPQSIRSRRASLVSAGKVRRTGEFRPSATGRRSIVWEAI